MDRYRRVIGMNLKLIKGMRLIAATHNPSKASISGTLPGLWVAATSRIPLISLNFMPITGPVTIHCESLISLNDM